MEAQSISMAQELFGSATKSSVASSPTEGMQQSFLNMLDKANSGSAMPQLEKTINYVQDRFNSKHIEVVNSIKKFEATGSAVALMEASHQGANKSVMVQLCGTVGKKCADNTEQLYKQQ